MTLLAGAYSRIPGRPLPDSLCDAVQAALSRHPNEPIERFRDDRCLLVKADVGAFGSAAHRVDARAASFVVGEPLLAAPGVVARARARDVETMHDMWQRGDSEPLTRARGVFAGAHYERESGRLSLITDKLGVRPLFYWCSDNLIVFASALRILEQIPQVTKRMNVRAVAEIGAFGFPLGDRTPYESICLLMPAETVEVHNEQIDRRRYWRWDSIAVSDEPVEALARASYERFSDAVNLRAGKDSATAAFLSGGLDSRAIVTLLRGRGMCVHTFNFANQRAQDQVFASAFADVAGVSHRELPLNAGRPRWSMLMADALKSSPDRVAHPIERPNIVWSGDGGSVGTGHVYLTREMIELARQGDPTALIELIHSRWGGDLPRRLMQPAVFDALADASRQRLREELASFQSADPGRALHLVLMQNDQRRHLAEHFETIDLHRLELELPFFDSDFLTSVASAPVDACLDHHYYMRWFEHFPGVARSVPWQTYPGHEPCPLPIPEGLGYQWSRTQYRAVSRAQKRELLREAAATLRAPDFPDPLMRKGFLRLASTVHRLGVRDLGYIMRTAQLYHDYWRRSSGNYRLTDPR